jgi:acetyl-CoA carboxylase biotin carboxyl carrier protein
MSKEERLDLNDIASIVELLKQNEITEFRLEREGEKLWLKRGSTAPASYTYQLPQLPPATHQASFQQLASTPNVVEEVAATLTTASSNGNLKDITSPMVGTFYRRPAVDAAPYVEVGAFVKKGDVLCIVEAMKLMNEIEAEVSGRIVEVYLEDGQMAEYGEPLFKIELS